MIISRITVPAIGAALMATALGLVMVKLIHVDFEAEPESEPIALFIETKEPEDPKSIVIHKPIVYQQVEVPPRINPIKNEDPTKPKEKPYDAGELKKVTFERPELDLHPADSLSIDKDEQPIQRVVAKVPRKALEAGLSGHCLMRFNVDVRGTPFNVEAYHCSNKIFERNSIEAAKKFKYLAKVKDGVPIDRIGVETRITYKVTDERGRVLPES